APVVRPLAVLAHDHPGDPGPARLFILVIDAVIADQGVGHADELPPERWVGGDLLVAGHRRRKDSLAFGIDERPEGRPAENTAVGEDERSLRPGGIRRHRGGCSLLLW